MRGSNRSASSILPLACNGGRALPRDDAFVSYDLIDSAELRSRDSGVVGTEDDGSRCRARLTFLDVLLYYTMLVSNYAFYATESA